MKYRFLIARLQVEARALRAGAEGVRSPRMDGMGAKRRGHVSGLEVAIAKALDKERESAALSDELALYQAEVKPVISSLQGELIVNAMYMRYIRRYSVRRIARQITRACASTCTEKRAERLLQLGRIQVGLIDARSGR